MLKTGPSSTTLTYDPLTRLYQSVGGGTTSRFAYDGLDALAEYNSTNALQRRWVYDPDGQPILWYEGSVLTDRRFLSADERGSIISTSNSSGAKLAINTYDEYGNPAAANSGRYGYTGQAWLPSVTLWYYKARVNEPQLGRFLQTDPIGYGDSPNLYNYVLSDPINLVDPLGLGGCDGTDPTYDCSPITITAQLSFFNGFLPSLSINFGPMPPVFTDRLKNLLKQVGEQLQAVICAVPSFELGGELAAYRGFGSRASGGLAYNTKTGDLFLKGSFGGGLGFGGGGAFGLSAQSATTSAGSRGSLDLRVALGRGLIGGDATYNLITVNHGQNLGSQGGSGSVAVAKAFLPGEAYGALEANLSKATKIGNLGTPCGKK